MVEISSSYSRKRQAGRRRNEAATTGKLPQTDGATIIPARLAARKTPRRRTSLS
jgi:hypothetical protein